MPRPAPWRLDLAAYPHRQTVQTRFQDLDVQGHLNNVAFAALFETARTRFNAAASLWGGSPRRRAVVAQVEINYLAEGSYPEDVVIGSGIGTIGGRSWQIVSAMFQTGRCLATCDCTIVMARGEGGEGLLEPMRAALEQWRSLEP